MTERIIRKPEVVNLTGLPHSTIYRLIKKGQFPAPIKLGERASGWLVSEIDNWIAARMAETRSLKAG